MQQVVQDEAMFLREYDPSDYPPVAVTVDVIALTIKDDKLVVLLLERDTHPFKGVWSLPGSFLRPDDPDLSFAAIRALDAKAKLHVGHIEQLGVYGYKDRDPRMRVVSSAWVAFAPDLGGPVAGKNVRVAEWVPYEDIKGVRVMAFDHDQIVRDAVHRARNKLEYTTLATSFLPETFTIGELRRVYATVWGKAPDAGNFYRKVKVSKGFLTKVGQIGRADLFRAGPARMLYPPIRREGGEWG